MATATHLPATLLKATGGLTSGQTINLSSDTINTVAVVAGNGIPLTAYTNDTTTWTGTWATTATTITVNSGTGLLPNMKIAGGAGLPSPCYIVSVSGTTVTISAATTAAQASAAALTVTGGVQFVSDVLATNTENPTLATPGTGTSDRMALTGLTWAYASGDSITSVDWSFSNIVYPQYASDNGTTRYFALYDSSGTYTADATRPVLAILDPGAAVSVVNGSLTLQAPAGGLIQMTGAG
jgi:hypothetical protein